jgi:putative nucleotidyltransferase with HDIG domain
MKRETALEILKKHIDNKNLIKHCLAVEAGMKGLAKHFQNDLDKWGLAGLLHDIDYMQTKDDPKQHAKIGAQICRDLEIAEDICQAIQEHNEFNGSTPTSLMAKALFCTDPLTGLIVASTLVLPSKKIKDLKTENILKRMQEPSFAKGANREVIKACQTLLGLALDEFIQIVLESMQSIETDLEL